MKKIKKSCMHAYKKTRNAEDKINQNKIIYHIISLYTQQWYFQIL